MKSTSPSVFLIEDERILAEELRRRLLHIGYRVEVAYDGDAGLAMVRKAPPDLLLLDIMLPKKNGFEILQEMHDDTDLRKVPVVIISNSGQPVEIDRALALGARDYLVKANFEVEEVIEKVQRIVPWGGPVQKSETPPHIVGGDARYASAEKLQQTTGPSALVVEDEKLLRAAIVTKLKTAGITPYEAISGEEALKILKTIKVNIILLDLVLPDVDGFEVIRTLKADPELSSIPVMVLSNLGQEAEIKRGKDLGAVDYLVKAHVLPRDIVEKVKNIIGVK